MSRLPSFSSWRERPSARMAARAWVASDHFCESYRMHMPQSHSGLYASPLWRAASGDLASDALCGACHSNNSDDLVPPAFLATAHGSNRLSGHPSSALGAGALEHALLPDDCSSTSYQRPVLPLDRALVSHAPIGQKAQGPPHRWRVSLRSRVRNSQRTTASTVPCAGSHTARGIFCRASLHGPSSFGDSPWLVPKTCWDSRHNGHVPQHACLDRSWLTQNLLTEIEGKTGLRVSEHADLAGDDQSPPGNKKVYHKSVHFALGKA